MLQGDPRKDLIEQIALVPMDGARVIPALGSLPIAPRSTSVPGSLFLAGQ